MVVDVQQLSFVAVVDVQASHVPVVPLPVSLLPVVLLPVIPWLAVLWPVVLWPEEHAHFAAQEEVAHFAAQEEVVPHPRARVHFFLPVPGVGEQGEEICWVGRAVVVLWVSRRVVWLPAVDHQVVGQRQFFSLRAMVLRVVV